MEWCVHKQSALRTRRVCVRGQRAGWRTPCFSCGSHAWSAMLYRSYGARTSDSMELDVAAAILAEHTAAVRLRAEVLEHLACAAMRRAHA
eukprot:2135995-Prymnesium_polylepis.1